MSCCDSGAAANSLADASRGRRAVLWVVLAINVTIFLGEYGAGWYGHSTALQSDSLDSLADALVYALSLWAVAKSVRARAGSALLKGAIQVLFALGIIVQAIYKWLYGAAPLPTVMWVAAGCALIGNLTCLALLSRFRADDINMRSVWLCSRNDVIGNAGVLVIATVIAFTRWGWLDVFFGAAMAALFLWTGYSILRTSWPQFQERTDGKLP